MADRRLRTAAVVVTWEGGPATTACVRSLRAQIPPPDEIVVVDNASGAAERAQLTTTWGQERGVRLLLLDQNRQFAGGMNAGAAATAGADRLFFLNNDTVFEPDALARLNAALDACPPAGIVGPRVMDASHPGTVLTLGERHILPLLNVPRTMLRYRRARSAAFRVLGVMGCALLVTRACYDAVGGFSEAIEVYYEDVDFCLGARARGFAILIEPSAVGHHDGMRGFLAGLTPWAAFLKARNPWLLVRRRGRAWTWITFVPTYALMVAASAALYALRGRRDIVRGLLRGALAGLRATTSAPPPPVGAPAVRG